MPRPLRLEYEGAFYHVMNRGKGRQAIFYDERYYRQFLEALSQAHQRFGLVIHGYCLMPNHYHLLLETPRGNLSRCMRHINGVYTQAFNQLRRTDGPLFRGRFKALLVDADSYFLQLSRYIHRNPIDGRRPLVERLIDFPWSSYPDFFQRKAPAWLESAFTLSQVQSQKAYKTFVEGDIDDEVSDILNGKSWPAILGDEVFSNRVYELQDDPQQRKRLARLQQALPDTDKIITQVCASFGVERASIVTARRGAQAPNVGRWLSIYLCREVSGLSQEHIAKAFNMGHSSGVNKAIAKLKVAISNDSELGSRVKGLIHDLTP